MQCLGLPIDHRLRRLIRKARPIHANREDSEHVRILHDFGTSLEIDGEKYLPIHELSFGVEMAKPESKGGIVVALLRPHSTQVYTDGFVIGRDGCRTLKAVASLITAVSDGNLSFDDISVFDAIPFLDETVTDQDIIDHAQNTFANMIRAKQPDVVICCHQAETDHPLVRNLCSTGVGKSFSTPTYKYSSSSTLLRVTAFHPSYAISRHPTYSCFRRLLILEFTKAFALWRHDWEEEPWMDGLRDTCRREASRVSREFDNGKTFPQQRWETILNSLSAGFDECGFFHKPMFNSATILQRKLTQANITWLCCDAANLLQIVEDEDCHREVSTRLLFSFKDWCSKTWPDGSLIANTGDSNGYYDHLPLLMKRSEQRTRLAKTLENRFQDLLRDLNLSYFRRLTGSSRPLVQANMECQREAFLRFAGAIENILEVALDSGICASISALSLG